MFHLALIGGEEFADGFEAVHEALIAPLLDGRSRGVYLPTCAAHDGLDVVRYWCATAQRRLAPFCAGVAAPLVVDADSASDAVNVELIRAADWVYLGGGHPATGMRILGGSAVLAAILDGVQQGKPLIGASAGAMMLCATSIALTRALAHGDAERFACLGLVPGTYCVPHYNRIWAAQIARHCPPDHTLVGLDEQVALVSGLGGSEWRVLGGGSAVVRSPGGEEHRYQASTDSISLR